MNVLLALPLAAALSIRFRRRFEETIAPAIFLMIIALYFSGIFTTLLPGVAACLAMSVTALVYCMIRWKKEFLSGILTPGALAFLLFALFFIAVNIGREFSWRDDLGHWARAVKNLLYYRDFSNIAASTDRNGSYPPAATLWNYLGALLFPRNGGFTVNRAVTPIADAAPAQFFSQEMLEAALFLPLFSSVKGLKSHGDRIRWILLVTAFYMLLTGAFSVWFSTVMVDPLLGLYGLFVLWMLLHERAGRRDRFLDIAVCSALFLLALTKEMGIVLAGLLATIGFFTFSPVRGGEHRLTDSGETSRLYSGRIRTTSMRLSAVAAAVFSWYGYLALWSGWERAASAISAGSTDSGVMGGGTAISGHVGTVMFKWSSLDPQLSRDIFRTYCYAVFNRNRASFGTVIPVSFVFMMCLCGILVILVTVRRVQSGSFIEADRRFCRLFAGAWIAGLIFCGGLGIAYVLVFRSIGVTLPSLDRYLAPVIVMLTGLMTGFLVERIRDGELSRIMARCAIGLLLLLFYGEIGQLYTGLTVREHRQLPVSEITEDLAAEGVVFTPEDRVYFLMKGDRVSDEHYALGYIITPAKMNERDFGIEREEVTDPEYDYLYDAELAAGERLFKRNAQTGAWEDYRR